MSVSFKIIKINMVLTLLRPLCIVVSCMPILFVKNQYSHFVSIWMLGFLILYFVLFFFVKRYKIVGAVTLAIDKIEIIQNNREKLTFINFDKLKLSIKINGYRGESTQFFFVTFSEGIGRLEINDSFKFDILAEKKFYKTLVEILNTYRQEGAYIDLKKR